MADSEGEQRPAKRPRTLESNISDKACSIASSEFAKNIERDSEFWLEDGNVVLVAQNTGFRVYKGLLAAQSPVFHDMFSAAGLQADERYDGVPVVPLFDSPVDLRHLLRVLLPKTQKDVLKDSYDLKTEFHVISALIRLAHKYQIEDVEKRSLSALCAIYPSNLERWLETDSTIDDEDRVYAIAAVNLARLTDTLSVLPSAFYHCALLLSRVLRGFTREDGTKEYLSESDLGRCMDGTAKLIAARTSTTLGLATSIQVEFGADNCWRPGLCSMALRSLSRSMITKPLHPDLEAHALSSESSRWTTYGLCDGCIAKLEKEEFASIAKLWARLPNIFRIEDIVDVWPGNP